MRFTSRLLLLLALLLAGLAPIATASVQKVVFADEFGFAL
jgi:hypothetical protein